MADIKSESRPASNRNRWPASYWNAWPASSESAHAFQIEGEKAARGMLSQEIKTAWQQHETAYGAKEARPQQAERKADRFGRSRDRKPRQRRREATTGQEIEAQATTGAEAENSSLEAGFLSGQFPTPANEQASHAQPEGQASTPAPEPTTDEREAEIKSLLERWQAERDQGRDTADPGREID